MKIKSKKELENILTSLEGFKMPKPELEQWMTPPDIASAILVEAFLRGNIREKRVADLGCGTGILAIGAALLGASIVYCVEVDTDALAVAFRNVEAVSELVGAELPIVFICSDVREIDLRADTVVMNPPFGLEKGSRHADLIFLKIAFRIAEDIYSLHRTSRDSRRFLRRVGESFGFASEILGTFRFPLKARYVWHRKKVLRIDVDFYHFFSSRNARTST